VKISARIDGWNCQRECKVESQQKKCEIHSQSHSRSKCYLTGEIIFPEHTSRSILPLCEVPYITCVGKYGGFKDPADIISIFNIHFEFYLARLVYVQCADQGVG